MTGTKVSDVYESRAGIYNALTVLTQALEDDRLKAQATFTVRDERGGWATWRFDTRFHDWEELLSIVPKDAAQALHVAQTFANADYHVSILTRKGVRFQGALSVDDNRLWLGGNPIHLRDVFRMDVRMR